MEENVEYKKKVPQNEMDFDFNLPVPDQEKKSAGHKIDENFIQKIQNHVDELIKRGLTIPPDYSVSNALMQAKLRLLNLRDEKTGALIIDQCTTSSIYYSLLKMILSGFNVAKKHCDFIKYKNQLICQPEYFGNLMIAKRDAGVKEVNGHCVYQGDEFVYEVDSNTGRMRLIKHISSLENQDISKIKGAYAIVIYNDGTSKMEVMTINQIKNAWEMGYAEGKSKAHMNFTDQQCIKTVMNRAIKIDINSSDDSEILLPSDEEFIDLDSTKKIAREKTEKKELDINSVKYDLVKNQEETNQEPY